MTMVVPVTGHQVRWILWDQGGMFNKGIGYGSKFFALNIFCEEYLKPKSMFDVANMLKNFTVKNVPVNIYEILNMAGSFKCLGAPPKHPNSSGKLLVLAVPQIST